MNGILGVVRQIFAILLVVCFMTPFLPGQSIVTLRQDDGRFRLIVDGSDFRVQGVGGQSHLDLLVKAGGNSIRTWSTEGLDEVLDEAHRHRLKVCVGLWLGHTRHGFDYQNQVQVEKQLKDCLETVAKYKNHPAVLMWGIGNEMEGDGTNPAIWYAVDHIAREIKKLDPNHPTLTVVAELGPNGTKLRAIEKYCPNIDIVGINSYGGVFNLPQRMKELEFRRPYIVTEHGPLGPWEAAKTRWNAAIEPSSTEKGELYAKGFQVNAVDNQAHCLGTFAFVWGHKQETTATWFGMLLPSGERLAAVDAMSKAWGRQSEWEECPAIGSIKLERADGLKPGEVIKGALIVSESSKSTGVLRWKVVSDSLQFGTGGDHQNEEAEIDTQLTSQGTKVEFRVPESGGAYRLFAYMRNGSGGAAVANVPFFVDAPVKPKMSPQAALPYFVYADAQEQSLFVPSGYMGNATAIEMDESYPGNPHAGLHCLRVQYKASDNWGGVLWQSPPNDWKGELPGGLNFSGASAVEFWARGERGDEVVSFVVGAIEGDTLYADTVRKELKDVALTNDWKKYRIDLGNSDLSRIKTAFGWSLASQGAEVTFYLDDIQYVAQVQANVSDEKLSMDKIVVLTFDDSSKSHYTVARPLLLKYQFGATFFITEGWDFSSNKKDYMTWEEIQQLDRDGFEIGNHTRDHLAITDATFEQLDEQLKGIEKRCQEYGIAKPVSFAWPGNARTEKAFPILREHGIRFARRGGEPEFPYEGGRGVPLEIGKHDLFLLPSAGDARPNWELENFVQAVEQAERGKVAILQFHGVPDTAHHWVSSATDKFEAYLRYLAINDFKVISLRDLPKYVELEAK